MMPEEWTGDLVKRMHMNGISAKDLAESAGVTSAYVSMLLHGARSPKGAQDMLESAVDRILEERARSANVS